MTPARMAKSYDGGIYESLTSDHAAPLIGRTCKGMVKNWSRASHKRDPGDYLRTTLLITNVCLISKPTGLATARRAEPDRDWRFFRVARTETREEDDLICPTRQRRARALVAQDGWRAPMPIVSSWEDGDCGALESAPRYVQQGNRFRKGSVGPAGQSLNKMRTRGRRVKPIGEILGFTGDQSFAEFHDAHRIRRYAVIG